LATRRSSARSIIGVAVHLEIAIEEIQSDRHGHSIAAGPIARETPNLMSWASGAFAFAVYIIQAYKDRSYRCHLDYRREVARAPQEIS